MLCSFLLCGCNSKSIVGKWVGDGNKGVFYDEIEFFSDGTQVTEHISWSGSYSTDGNRLAIIGRVYSETFTYELRDGGDVLALINSNGTEKEYTRVK